MELIIYTSIGVIAGLLIGWLLGKSRAASGIQAVRDEAQIKYNDLDRELIALKATSASELTAAQQQLADRQQEYHIIKADLLALSTELDNSRQLHATVKAAYDTTRQTLIEKNNEHLRARTLNENLQAEQGTLHQQLATALATNKAQAEKLQTQKEEMEAMSKKFNTEFENIANRILETKTSTFTELNKNNMKNLLEPLGQNIREFKQQVQDAYGKESNERFSLQNEVKNLLLLNQQLSKEAQNLTRALKSESKTQGRWGELILEKILDKSGLRKNEEFFMEYQ